MDAPAAVLRVSHRRVIEQVLPAFEAATQTARLDPLAPFVPGDELDPEKHILTGRRYLVFGPEEAKFIGGPVLLRAALRQMATERLALGDLIPRVIDALRASGRAENVVQLLTQATAPDHGLPDWLASGMGPSLVAPHETSALRSALTSLRSQLEAEDDGVTADRVARLLGFIERADASDAIAFV